MSKFLEYTRGKRWAALCTEFVWGTICLGQLLTDGHQFGCSGSTMLKFLHVRFCLCQNVKFGNYESAVSCVTSWVMSWSDMQNQGRRDFIDIGAFHYAHMVKSILWTVIGCWPCEFIHWCIYILACFSHVTGYVLNSCTFYFCLPAGH